MLFRVERHDWGNKVCLYAAAGGETRAYAEPVVFAESNTDCCAPFLELNPEAAQRLVDELWASGLRPSRHTDEASKIDAVQYHLEDMRKLVFEKNEQS